MATSKRDLLITALKNAYGLEGQGETNLGKFHDDLQHYPDLKARVGLHLEETKRQKERLGECLTTLGESPSSFKETAMKLAAGVQGLIHGLAGDEVLKSTFSAYAFENFEIAGYKSLVAMAEACGEPQVAATCRDILKEEEATAAWFGQNIESITRAYMAREATGATANA